MSKIGFDFGTTNSVISFFDEEKKALDCFRPQASNNSYIPTVISYGKVTEIGESAKAEIGSLSVYSHFKLRLGTKFDEQMPEREKTAHEVARDYIKYLMQLYQEAGNEIEDVVMTIPEAWYRENSNFMARENLKALYQELGMEQVRFQSEPIAAAAYFCWRYQYQQTEENPEKKLYHGKLMIIDFGGGTLDVTVCDVKNGTTIRVLDSCGFGEENGREGCAGSAFDGEVVRLMCKEENIELNSHDFAAVRDEFEQKLIAKSKRCEQMMADYFEYPAGMEDEPLFSLNLLGGKQVLCRHLQSAFDTINRPVIEQAITAMQTSSALEDGIFQVVMVGGFSNFCCVEAFVREMFGSRMGAEDTRFTRLLSQENKALAVAKGAALLANQKISVEPVFPYELGIVIGEADENFRYHDCFIPLIQKGTLTESYEEPVYADETVMILPEGTSECYIRMYIGPEKERLIFAIDESVSELFPKITHEEEYAIGLRVDGNMIPELCIKPTSGEVRRTQLNKLLERILVRKAKKRKTEE